MKTELIVTEKDEKTPFSPFKVNGHAQRENNSVVKSPTRPNFELIRDFMPVFVSEVVYKVYRSGSCASY